MTTPAYSGLPDSFAPPHASAPGDVASEGTSNAKSRSDHVHAREAADANLGGTPTTSAVGDSASVGTSTTGAHSDHRHGREGFGSPVASAVGDSAADGTAATVAHSDHKHAREAFATTADIADIAATESAGTAATVPHGDHVHALPSLAAWTTYSPSFTNVSSGAGTFKYLQHGKTVFLKGHFSAGTATAGGAIQVALPAGITAVESVVVGAQNNNTPVASNIVSGGSTVRVFKDLSVTNWTAGDSIASVHYDCVFEAS